MRSERNAQAGVLTGMNEHLLAAGRVQTPSVLPSMLAAESALNEVEWDSLL